VAVALVLAGCTNSAAHPTPAPTTPTATPTAAPVSVTAGSTTITVQPLDSAAVATATPVDDGTARLSLSAGDAILTGPPNTAFRALEDGTAVVEDGAGAFVAGLSVDGPGVRMVQETPGSVRLTGIAPLGVWMSSVAVQDAVWGTNEGGQSLAVTPTAWARAGGAAANDGLWSQLVVREPSADTPTMRAQLECHELGAPDKATWNLEPWRPDVSTLEMIAARCNPE
jgi:hypothetical protein